MGHEVVIALCSLAGTLVGSVGGVVVAGRLTTYRLEQLEKKMDKHNGLIERMAVVERDQRTLFKYHDDHTEQIDRLKEG